MKSWFSKFFSRDREKVICFRVENCEQLYNKDCEIISKLEKALSQGGVIPAKIDFPSKLCCVTLAGTNVGADDVLKMLQLLGFKATLIQDIHHGSSQP